MQLRFAGSGVSCGIPVIGHDYSYESRCCCGDAVRNPQGKNNRNNISLLITILGSNVDSGSVGDHFNILIDAGKTFRSAYLRVLLPAGLRYFNALLLTHGHADAMQCVEEVVDLHHNYRVYNGYDDGDCAKRRTPPSLLATPTYLTPKTLKEIEFISPRLLPLKKKEGEGEEEENLSCTQAIESRLDYHLLSEEKVEELLFSELDEFYEAHGVRARHTFYTFPVEHGKNYISLGFIFGPSAAFEELHSPFSKRDETNESGGGGGKSCVVYLSDISEIPLSSSESALFQYLLHPLTSSSGAEATVTRDSRQIGTRVGLLVFDLLSEKNSPASPSHTTWPDVMPYVRLLTPVHTLCVGMFCSIEHAAGCAELAEDLQREKRIVRRVLGYIGSSGDGSDERNYLDYWIEAVNEVEMEEHESGTASPAQQQHQSGDHASDGEHTETGVVSIRDHSGQARRIDTSAWSSVSQCHLQYYATRPVFSQLANTRAKLEQFIQCVESVALAYDGLTLNLP